MHVDVVQELVGQLTGGTVDDGSLRTLLDALPDAIVVVDERGIIVFAGDAIERLSGYAPAELAGQPVEALVPSDRRAVHLRDRETYVAAPSPRSMGAALDITLAHRDGSEVAVDISLSPIETGGHRFVVAAVRDATERHEAEAAVRGALARERAATEQLREVAAAKDAFLRAVSHDLRTPLTAVLGLAETLDERAAELASQETASDLVAELSGRIAANARRLDGLLTDLLDVDRLTRGAILAERRPTEVVARVAAAIDRCVPADRRVYLDAPDELTADVDPTQLDRIVENLLTNACKHTPRPGAVTVRLAQHVAGEAGGDGLWLAVEDEGPGIPVAEREAIFEPFARLEAAEHTPGSGVGLSLVAQFARLHGGGAWVEDAPGGGASFQVRLPGAPPA